MLIMISTIVAMILLGAIVWRMVQAQEAGDEKFEAKLKADDDRAHHGRTGEAQSRQEK